MAENPNLFLMIFYISNILESDEKFSSQSIQSVILMSGHWNIDFGKWVGLRTFQYPLAPLYSNIQWFICNNKSVGSIFCCTLISAFISSSSLFCIIHKFQCMLSWINLQQLKILWSGLTKNFKLFFNSNIHIGLESLKTLHW